MHGQSYLKLYSATLKTILKKNIEKKLDFISSLEYKFDRSVVII